MKGDVTVEYILIGDAKIKVMLEQKDMEYYDISAIDIDYENAATRRAFRRILEDVKARTGFDMTCEQVLVQVYPSRDGGCEMFVTKLSQTKEENQKLTSYPKEITMLSIRLCGYLFSSFEHLLSAVFELHKRGSPSGSSLFYTEEGNWLLLLEEKACSGTKRSLGELCFLEEFAEKKKGPLHLAYIKEHSKPVIAYRAVEKLTRRFG